MAKYLDSTGLVYLWSKIKAFVNTGLGTKINTSEKGADSGVATLDANGKIPASQIPSGYANEITGIQVNGVTINPQNGVVNIANASSAFSGAMSASEHTKLNGIETGAQVNIIEGALLGSSDYRISVDENRMITIPYATHRNPVGTTSTPGIISERDKEKLDSVSDNAEENQLAFSTIALGTNDSIAADSKTSTLNFVASQFNKVTISNTDYVGLRVVKSTSTGALPQHTYVDLSQFIGYAKAQSLYDAGTRDNTRDVFGLTLGGFYGLVPKIFTSPALTGTPTAPTATSGTNTTQIATTAFVQAAISNGTSGISDLIGSANGICPLDANTKIDAQYLPSYVDDVIEAYARTGQTALTSTWLATGSASGTVITPEAGKIYVLMADNGDYAANSQFRWGGTAYVKLNDGGVSAITTAEIDAIVAN